MKWVPYCSLLKQSQFCSYMGLRVHIIGIRGPCHIMHIIFHKISKPIAIHILKGIVRVGRIHAHILFQQIRDTITIIGIPFAKAAFRIAGFVAFPFGKELIDVRDMGQTRLFGTGLANFLWIILAGIWLFISHIMEGIACCLTIIGIPFGLAHFNIAIVCFAPLGKKPVNKSAAVAARNSSAEANLQNQK